MVVILTPIVLMVVGIPGKMWYCNWDSLFKKGIPVFNLHYRVLRKKAGGNRRGIHENNFSEVLTASFLHI